MGSERSNLHSPTLTLLIVGLPPGIGTQWIWKVLPTVLCVLQIAVHHSRLGLRVRPAKRDLWYRYEVPTLSLCMPLTGTNSMLPQAKAFHQTPGRDPPRVHRSSLLLSFIVSFMYVIRRRNSCNPVLRNPTPHGCTINVSVPPPCYTN